MSDDIEVEVNTQLISSTGVFRVNVLRSESQWDALEPEWNDLLSRCRRASFFCTFEWLRPWWRHHRTEDDSLHLITVREAGRLMGIAPMFRRQTRILGVLVLDQVMFIGDGSGDSEYLDIVTDDTATDAVLDHILARLASDESGWQVARFSLMNRESPTVAALRRMARSRELSLSSQLFSCLRVPLADSWDVYLKAVGKRQRRTIRSGLRWLSTNDTATVEICKDDVELSERLESLFALHEARWTGAGQRGAFSDSRRRDFYRDLASELLKSRRLRLYSLRYEGSLVAHEFDFEHAAILYCLQMGFDSSLRDMSVGTVLRSYVLRDCVERGIRGYDFLAGDDAYKKRWKPSEIPCLHITVWRKGWRSACYLHGLRVLSETRRFLRDRSPRAALTIKRRVVEKLREIRLRRQERTSDRFE